MSKSLDLLIEKLLSNTLRLFCSKLGLVDPPEPLTLEEIASLLNAADALASTANLADHSKAIVLCGLISEIVPDVAIAVAPYISRILLKVGLTPTARMVQAQLKYHPLLQEGPYLNDLGSYFDNAYSSLSISSNQIFLNGVQLQLTEFQKRIWDAVDRKSHVGISAPTSAGKSFVICAKIISNFVDAAGTVIFVVPTISLVNQVSRDISDMAKKFNVEGIRILKSFGNKLSAFELASKKTVYVVTQERASALFDSRNNLSIARPITVVVDEVQNIEQSGDESNERAMLLLEVIHKFINELKPDKFLASGPRLANLESVLTSWVEGDVSLTESEKIPTVVNVSYSFKGKARDTKTILVSQYVEGFKPNSLQVLDTFQLREQILSKKNYNDLTYKFLAHVSTSLRKDGGSLIFAKSSSQAFKTACELSSLENTNIPDNLSLSNYARETVHPLYGLATCFEKGIGYHHGKVPPHMRNTVESAFSLGRIDRLVCTTTLMQGVNLPAKNIIVRNPDLTSSRKLTGYEFSNLRGRAGRLMKDFVGRAIMIDEKSFSEEEISLEVTTNKDLDYTYKSKFDVFGAEITELIVGSKELRNAEMVSSEMAIYVKHLVYKTSLFEAEKRLSKLGIFIQHSVLKKIKEDVLILSVPRDIVLANPFWDPFDLDRLYKMIMDGAVDKITKNPLGQLKKGLEGAASFMNLNFPYYSEKYLNVVDAGKLGSVCSFAASWARGTSLRSIIDPPNWPVTNAKDVEDRIATISGKIPFGLTKLLKPLVESQDKENRILTYIEAGCYRGEHRALLSLGLSREVILRVLPKSALSTDEVSDVDLNIQQMLEKLWYRSRSSELSEWDRLQIDETVKLEDI